MKAKPSAMFGDVVYVFESTGRSFTPNDGIWGLTSDFQPRGGYDDTYYVTSNDPDDYQPEYSTLTHAECVELGEYMAAQWRAFADKHRGAAVEQAQALATAHGEPQDVTLYRYDTDAELWERRPDMAGLPVTCHAALLARARRLLSAAGFRVVIAWA